MAIKKPTILIPLASEFEVRTVFYGPSYFPAARIYGPGVKCAGHKLGLEKTRLVKCLSYLWVQIEGKIWILQFHYIDPSDPYILSNELSGRPHQSQQPSFTTLSPPEILMLSFIHKTHAVSNFFYHDHAKRTACFYEPQLSRISWNVSLSDSLLRKKRNFKQKS